MSNISNAARLIDAYARQTHGETGYDDFKTTHHPFFGEIGITYEDELKWTEYRIKEQENEIKKAEEFLKIQKTTAEMYVKKSVSVLLFDKAEEFNLQFPEKIDMPDAVYIIEQYIEGLKRSISCFKNHRKEILQDHRKIRKAGKNPAEVKTL
jgi:cysteinyl-tRNA synthetase